MTILNKILISTAIFTTLAFIFTLTALGLRIEELKNLNNSLENRLELKQKESAGYEAALALQSAQVKQFELDLQAAKTALQNTNKAINKKYNNIKAQADTCEAKLEAIEKIAEAFFAKDN